MMNKNSQTKESKAGREQGEREESSKDKDRKDSTGINLVYNSAVETLITAFLRDPNPWLH